jgi:hypothetical protein
MEGNMDYYSVLDYPFNMIISSFVNNTYDTTNVVDVECIDITDRVDGIDELTTKLDENIEYVDRV